MLVASSTPLGAQDAAPSTAAPVAHALVRAFNDHDPDAMARLVTADFELFYVDADGVAARAVRGPAELRTEMTAYFEANPGVRSTVEGEVDGPVYVSFRERIEGGDSSLAVYEVRAGKVRRAWYFPAER